MLTFPIFLIAVLVLTFFVAWKSQIHWGYKVGIALLYFSLITIFWSSATSYLGYPADGKLLDGKTITVFSVVVQEPTKDHAGGFYLTATDRIKKYDSAVMRLFGAKLHPYNPKLFVLPYDKQQHENMKKLQSKANKGQPVTGKFKFESGKKGKKGPNGKGTAQGQKGGGGESPGGAEYEFHELPPHMILPKGDPKQENPLDFFDSGRTFQT